MFDVETGNRYSMVPDDLRHVHIKKRTIKNPNMDDKYWGARGQEFGGSREGNFKKSNCNLFCFLFLAQL